MSKAPECYLENCLYFTANSLSRVITKMAEEEFRSLGMSPSHAFLIMIVAKEKVISQKELSKHLNLAQSTVSRLVDSLILKNHLRKTLTGKETRVTLTSSGHELLPEIHDSWNALYDRYSIVLGKKDGDKLTADTYRAFSKLNQ